MSEKIIALKNVNKVFNLPTEKVYSLKETLINFARGKLAYKKIHVLRDINLEIKKGEFLGIIGRNGSGKSTLLKIIAGIYEPTSGKVVVKDKISSFLELGLGFNSDLSARDNVYLYCAILGMSKDETDRKIHGIFKFAGLEKFMNAPLKAFSSGMQVRLAFSAAIQTNAPILLVDEVLAVGDMDFQKKCLNVFRRFKKEGKTVIFVSHDMISVRGFCDKVICLENGGIAKVSGKEETINYYINAVKESQ